jgi:Ca2+-binding EF-hand superfamily protein
MDQTAITGRPIIQEIPMNFVQKAALITLAVALPFGVAVAATSKMNGKSSHRAQMLEQFTKMDANKDGSVTQKEIHAYRKSWFSGGDSDSDGALSLAELDTMMAAFRAGHLKRRLAMMDTDGDGSVDGEEFARFRGRWMHHIDADGSGAIDKAEIEKAANHRGHGHRKFKSKHSQHDHR